MNNGYFVVDPANVRKLPDVATLSSLWWIWLHNRDNNPTRQALPPLEDQLSVADAQTGCVALREGPHVGASQKACVNRSPSRAILSNAGVLTTGSPFADV